MDVSAWQARLTTTFSEDGIIGPRLLSIIHEEQEYASLVSKNFHGYLVLTDSFQDFFIETLKLAPNLAGQTPPKSYTQMYLDYATNFKKLRAAERLLVCGYPLSGYSLLRDIKDSSITLSAIISGITSIDRVKGHSAVSGLGRKLTDQDFKKRIKNARKLEEQRIFKEMIGSNSGLGEKDIAELDMWTEMFHVEIHGSRFTYFLEGGDWLTGKGLLYLGPSFNEKIAAMYLNRSNEICWMLLRILPFLQLNKRAFGDGWSKKWDILDDSFRMAVEELLDLGKEIGGVMKRFIDSKFPFSPDTYYIERS